MNFINDYISMRRFRANVQTFTTSQPKKVSMIMHFLRLEFETSRFCKDSVTAATVDLLEHMLPQSLCSSNLPLPER